MALSVLIPTMVKHLRKVCFGKYMNGIAAAKFSNLEIARRTFGLKGIRCRTHSVLTFEIYAHGGGLL